MDRLKKWDIRSLAMSCKVPRSHRCFLGQFIIFVNVRVGKFFEINSKSLLCFHLKNLIDNLLCTIGDRMALALQDRRELKREYGEPCFYCRKR